MGCLPDYFCFFLSIPFHIRFIIIFIFMLLLPEGQAGEACHIDALSEKENVSVLKGNIRMCKGILRRVNFLLSAEHIVV
jgi:hypothetical protein